jgi:putative flippase GtrA
MLKNVVFHQGQKPGQTGISAIKITNRVGLEPFYANASAVLVTNIFGYVTNVLWVFQGGRHSRLMEFLLFSTVTFSCLILGALFGPLMMAVFGISEKLSLFVFILVSTGANFYIRKNWVFRC